MTVRENTSRRRKASETIVAQLSNQAVNGIQFVLIVEPDARCT